MADIGLVLSDDLGGFTLDDTVHFARLADDAGFHSVWKPEASGSNGLMALAAAARETEDVRLGTGIVNVFSRSPALLGMSAATLDDLSDGRALLGIGASSPELVETWHDEEFERPLRRIRETVEIVREILDGGIVHYEGEIFEVGPFRMALDAGEVPIYNGAGGPVNQQLTAEFCDGWIPGYFPPDHLAGLVDDMEANARDAGREPPTVAMLLATAVSDDEEHAAWRVRELLAQEMAMGYNEGMEQFGFREEADEAFERFRSGDREGAAEAISEEMIDSMAIHGTPEAVREQYEHYLESGVDVAVAMPAWSSTTEELEELVEALEPLA